MSALPRTLRRASSSGNRWSSPAWTSFSRPSCSLATPLGDPPASLSGRRSPQYALSSSMSGTSSSSSSASSRCSWPASSSTLSTRLRPLVAERQLPTSCARSGWRCFSSGNASSGAGHFENFAKDRRQLLLEKVRDRSAKRNEIDLRVTRFLQHCEGEGKLPSGEETAMLIAALGRGSLWQRSLQLFREAEARGALVLRTATATLNACRRARQWELALSLARELDGEDRGFELDEIAFSMLAAAARRGGGGQWELSLAICEEGRRRGFSSAGMASEAVASLGFGGHWEQTLQLLEEWCFSSETGDAGPNQANSTDVAVAAAVNACARSVAWEASLGLLDRLSTGSIEAVGAAASALTKAKRWREGLQLLYEAEQSGFKLTKPAYVVALAACEEGLEWRLSLQLLEELQAKNIPIEDLYIRKAAKIYRLSQRRDESSPNATPTKGRL